MAAAGGKRGRSPHFSDAAIQFCLTIKNLFGLALRQTTGFVQSQLALSGLPGPVPDFSALCRRQRSLDVLVAYQPSSAGLHLMVDSTGIKFLGEGQWKCKQHGVERRGQWRKLHLGIDADTMQIRAIVVTTNEVGDSPVGAELLNQIPSHETVVSLTGDGAYDTQDVHEACHRRGSHPRYPAAQRSKAAQRTGIHPSQ